MWKTRSSYAQSLRSEISPKQWIPAEQSPPGAPEKITGSASQEGSRRLLRSQPRRLGFGDPTRRDPGGAVRTYHEGRYQPLKTGTFYLAGNRNFLFGSDSLAQQTIAALRRCVEAYSR